MTCDCYIRADEKLIWVKTSTLESNRERLGTSFFEMELPKELVEYYRVKDEDLQDCLLSPNATLKVSKTGIISYSCCESCHLGLRKDRHDKGVGPSKFFISNGWAIGEVPKEHQNSSDLLAILVTPYRPYSYILSYRGGAHKSLKGSYTFFNNNPKFVQHVLNTIDIQKKGADGILCMLSGRMTKDQRRLAKEHCTVDIKKFNALFSFLQNNNKNAYKNVKEVPSEDEVIPHIIFDEENDNNTDDSKDPVLEKKVEVQYFFPDHGMPNQKTGVYEKNAD